MTEIRKNQTANRQSRQLHTPPTWVIEDPNRLIKIDELMALVGAGGKSTIYDWMKAGILPEGINVTPGSVRWRYGDVITALAELANRESAA